MIKEFSDWLSTTALSKLFATLSWFVPVVQTIHILAIGAIITMLTMVNFRLLGITRSGPTAQSLSSNFFPKVWWVLLVLLITGTLLTVTEPARELMNNAFRLKMVLVLVLVGVTVALQFFFKESGSSMQRTRRYGTLLAVASLVLCVSIVFAGRFIAYV